MTGAKDEALEPRSTNNTLHKNTNYFQEERTEGKSCVDQLALKETILLLEQNQVDLT